MMTSSVHEFELKENSVTVNNTQQEQSVMDIIFGNNEPPSFVTKEVSFMLIFFKIIVLGLVLLKPETHLFVNFIFTSVFIFSFSPMISHFHRFYKKPTARGWYVRVLLCVSHFCSCMQFVSVSIS